MLINNQAWKAFLSLHTTRQTMGNQHEEAPADFQSANKFQCPRLHFLRTLELSDRQTDNFI